MLGPKIQNRMNELGIKTQTELAEKSGLSVQYINDLLSGRRGQRIGFQAGAKLARALKVKPIFFVIDSAPAGFGDVRTATADGEVSTPCPT